MREIIFSFLQTTQQKVFWIFKWIFHWIHHERSKV